ncbi:cysteine desulfurase NifS [candidate division KSB1 bacterium]|nr:cysteine desulfurase NifS [candidate division KSB1 bacterium]NIR71863.1 cysteine desulfurase NifS [candidate division KSB1 bacterium]NIS26430.1 cysteine desulfurase NifS [candidate division KSB1 bacterium]NIT73200.1 cysteine desulfurase NifS [candidate division KSB1 bacterium]NIU27114.1 cysteine desulfurase NifS [candidate division KSB1 bacterium]
MTHDRKNNRIYLDHSATTPVDPQVVEAMLPYFTQTFGNASSIHSFGQDAKVAMEDARRHIADLIGAEPAEIVFTSGGTEADNWAIKGAAYFFENRKKHVVTSRVEHHAVLYACKYLEKRGFDVTYLPPDKYGMVAPERVAEAIRDDTFLVSIMHANNEIGTINPIREIGEIVHDRDVLFHADAVQSVGKIPVSVKDMNVDLLSLSGHKIYGPKGIGALYIRSGVKVEKFLHGGRHERDRRAGTENVAAAVGLGKAAEICRSRMEEDMQTLRKLSEEMRGKLERNVSGLHLNGHQSRRIPGIVNFSFEGVQSDSLMLSLDLKGIAVSNGSACTSGTVEPSHVLRALGLPHNLANSAIRFSLGRENTSEEIDYTVVALKEILERLRGLKRGRR